MSNTGMVQQVPGMVQQQGPPGGFAGGGAGYSQAGGGPPPDLMGAPPGACPDISTLGVSLMLMILRLFPYNR